MVSWYRYGEMERYLWILLSENISSDFFNKSVKQKDMHLQERMQSIYFYLFLLLGFCLLLGKVTRRWCSTGSGWRKARRGSPSSRLPAQLWTKLGQHCSPPWGRWWAEVPCNQPFCSSAGSSMCIKSIF